MRALSSTRASMGYEGLEILGFLSWPRPPLVESWQVSNRAQAKCRVLRHQDLGETRSISSKMGEGDKPGGREGKEVKGGLKPISHAREG